MRKKQIEIRCGGKLTPVSKLRPNPDNPHHHGEHCYVLQLGDILEKINV